MEFPGRPSDVDDVNVIRRSRIAFRVRFPHVLVRKAYKVRCLVASRVRLRCRMSRSACLEGFPRTPTPSTLEIDGRRGQCRLHGVSTRRSERRKSAVGVGRNSQSGEAGGGARLGRGTAGRRRAERGTGFAVDGHGSRAVVGDADRPVPAADGNRW